MTRTAFYRRTAAPGRLLAAGAGALLGGGALVALGAPGLGWALLVVGAGLALFGTSQGGQPKEALILDQRGVTDAILGYGTIPWEQIVLARAEQLGRFWIVGLEVTNPEEWAARTPASMAALRRLDPDHALPTVLLMANRLNQSAEEIARQISARARGARAPG